jgi:hypothetical protein
MERIMDIQSAKLELVKLIVSIENPQVIERLIDTIQSDSSDFWNGLSLSTKEEIRLGIEQLELGNKIRFEDFIDRVS